MPWCPKCKNEYIEGITVCADCGTKLVESLEENDRDEKLISLSEYRMLQEQMELLAEESEDTIESDGITDTETGQKGKKPAWNAPYLNSAQKAEDNKSSAYTLLFVGIVGLAASVLILTGIIPLYRNAPTTRYFVCGVMGALFLLFIIFGIVSMKTFKVLSLQAKSEDFLVKEITKWCDENLTAERIDEGLFAGEELVEEQKYFKRADRMKKLIQDKYMNLEEAFLDHFVDDYYQNLF